MQQEQYVLDDQVGFLLRRAHQRHRLIFTTAVENEVVPTQFAALAKLREQGPLSQNALGRMTAMDSATIAGVVERLVKRDLVSSSTTAEDSRMRIVDLTDDGRESVDRLIAAAREATDETLAPLSSRERETLLRLLARIC